MEKYGVAWTRANYIQHRWGCELPEVWNESEIPEPLRDWSKGGPEGNVGPTTPPRRALGPCPPKFFLGTPRCCDPQRSCAHEHGREAPSRGWWRQFVQQWLDQLYGWLPQSLQSCDNVLR